MLLGIIFNDFILENHFNDYNQASMKSQDRTRNIIIKLARIQVHNIGGEFQFIRTIKNSDSQLVYRFSSEQHRKKIQVISLSFL
ncbi:hypothetical protein CEE45_03930 [Candidatus Heimdallarchaeota archaeon B3_Heim]|nr:MAG: hypothetical protein CEE45_03930 [Candidatus Heimdallarchaeota archaeon B3_Heim]